MTGNVIETVMGAVVLVVAAVFLFFAYTTSQVRAVQGYDVTAQFERVGALRDGGDVRIAGVKIGSVVSETLDPKTFLATVRMSIDPAYKLPEESEGLARHRRPERITLKTARISGNPRLRTQAQPITSPVSSRLSSE